MFGKTNTEEVLALISKPGLQVGKDVFFLLIFLKQPQK
jgi:hypothetical protein